MFFFYLKGKLQKVFLKNFIISLTFFFFIVLGWTLQLVFILLFFFLSKNGFKKLINDNVITDKNLNILSFFLLDLEGFLNDFVFKKKPTLFYKFIILVFLCKFLIYKFIFSISFLLVSFYLTLIYFFFFSFVSKKNIFLTSTVSILFFLISFYLSFSNLFGYFYDFIIGFDTIFIKNINHIVYNNYIIYIGQQGFLSLGVENSMAFYLNSNNVLFVFLTIIIGLFVNVYTFVYMKKEPFLIYFVVLLNLFLFSMIFFLLSYTLTSLFFGWELIGLFSFLLINFWTNKVSTKKAAYKALIFNKLSDLSFLIVFIISLSFSFVDNVTSFKSIFLLSDITFIFFNRSLPLLFFYIFFLTICCFCKSAQLGFHVWLPDSMEAPIPASALIHSATLVSAGLYLMFLSRDLFMLSGFTKFIFFWCSTTAFYGGFVSSFQTDLKKILAYSTISHCGFLFCLIIFNLNEFFYFYFFNHGIYKSLSFIIVGLIVSSSRYQDFRRIGSFKKNYYIYKNVLATSLFNLGGLPFSIGFFSKYFLVSNINILSFNYFSLLFLHLSCYNGFFYSLNIYNNIFNVYNKSNYINKPSNNILFKRNIIQNIMTYVVIISVIFLTIFNVSLLITCYDVFIENDFKFINKNFFFLEFFNFIYFIFIFFYFFKLNISKLFIVFFVIFLKFIYLMDIYLSFWI